MHLIGLFIDDAVYESTVSQNSLVIRIGLRVHLQNIDIGMNAWKMDLQRKRSLSLK